MAPPETIILRQNKAENTLFRVYEKNKSQFENWLFEKNSQNYCEGLMSAIKIFFKEKEINLKNIKLIIETNNFQKKATVRVIRNLLNFCEEFELIDLDLITRYRSKVKVNFKSNIDFKVPTDSQIKFSLSKIENKFPQFLILYKLMIETGMRFTELKYFILNFDKSNVEINKETVIYRNFYLRKLKNSFYILFSKKTYEQLLKEIDNISGDFVNKFKFIFDRNRDLTSLKYLRKYNFTKLIQSEINFEIAIFIQGRSSQDIGFNHYLAKKEIAIREYKKALPELTKLSY